MTAAAIMALSATAAFAGLEFNACNWTSAPHFNLPGLVKDAGPRKSLLADLKARNLELMALNANGNQLHPLDGKRQSDDLYDTIRVAGDLGVQLSACPACPVERPERNYPIGSFRHGHPRHARQGHDDQQAGRGADKPGSRMAR